MQLLISDEVVNQIREFLAAILATITGRRAKPPSVPEPSGNARSTIRTRKVPGACKGKMGNPTLTFRAAVAHAERAKVERDREIKRQDDEAAWRLEQSHLALKNGRRFARRWGSRR